MGGTAVPNGYLPIGERIRHRRRARGLSQLRLAGLVDRTEDWVSKVERGEIPVDRISVLVRVADALKVPLSDLLGEQNWSEEQTASPQETAGLRRVLSTLPGTARAAPRAVSELEADLLSATRLRAQARYAAAAAALPGLITDLEVAAEANEGDDRNKGLGRPARAVRRAAPAAGGGPGAQGRPGASAGGPARGRGAQPRSRRPLPDGARPPARHPVRSRQRGRAPGVGRRRPRRRRPGAGGGATGRPGRAVDQPLLATPDRRGARPQLPSRHPRHGDHTAGRRAVGARAAQPLPPGPRDAPRRAAPRAGPHEPTPPQARGTHRRILTRNNLPGPEEFSATAPYRANRLPTDRPDAWVPGGSRGGLDQDPRARPGFKSIPGGAHATDAGRRSARRPKGGATAESGGPVHRAARGRAAVDHRHHRAAAGAAAGPQRLRSAATPRVAHRRARQPAARQNGHGLRRLRRADRARRVGGFHIDLT